LLEVKKRQEEVDRWNKDDFKDSCFMQYDTVMMDTWHLHLLKHIECTKQRMNSDVNYGIYSIIILILVINSNNIAIVMQDVKREKYEEGKMRCVRIL
jgi:hypothetical protein